METKNLIIQDFGQDLQDVVSLVVNKTYRLNDNAEENLATIRTLNALLESVRSATVTLQDAIDKYGV